MMLRPRITRGLPAAALWYRPYGIDSVEYNA
jgi:hypothetical protein